MSLFDFNMPVRIISGKGCVKANADLFTFGKKCFIVTGRNSAKASGALDDVTSVLASAGIDYIVFDKIGENPLLSVCAEGGHAGAVYGADFIIGIGGGSPLDASKAIAAFAANDGIMSDELFGTGLKQSLPLIGIPTTAGTGSEVNPYAVMTLDGENRKKTFKSQASYFKYAFCDPSYTMSLSAMYTVSTALDAFCHCFESFMSPKSTDISRLFAVYGAKTIWQVLFSSQTDFDYSKRERLMYAATAGGIAINTTGTGFPHPMGYNLTLTKGVPHGRACAVFAGEYIRYMKKSDEGALLVARFADAIGVSEDELALRITELADVKISLDADTIEYFIKQISSASNFANAPYKLTQDDMCDIYTKLFR